MENKQILHYQQLDSTNTKIKELAREGADHGTVVVADMQTAGRGRRGRSWESPAGTNIYMSVLLKPELEPSKAPMLTLVMAYSIAKVLQRRGYEGVQIKWPNDLILSGKKVCGILTEMELGGQEISHVVIGVGINANGTVFPKELQDKATSLYLEQGELVNREELIHNIIYEFESDFSQFLTKKDLHFLMDEYNKMLVNLGREVRVLEPNNEYTGKALGINKDGELVVQKGDGNVEAVFAGEVSVRGIYGYV